MSPPKLSDEHRAHLRTSGLTDETIEACGFYSVKSTAEITKLLKWKGPPRDHDWRAGIAMPFFAPGTSEKPAYVRVRPDSPRMVEEKGQTKERKYEQPKGTPVIPYFPPRARTDGRLADASRDILFAEGEKKAALLEQLGYVAIGAPGVWNFHDVKARTDEARYTLHPILREHVTITGRRCVIVFDSDASVNPMVMNAAGVLSAMLIEAGAREVLFTHPPHGVSKKLGIDDYFVAQGEHGARAVAELIEHAQPIEPASLSAKDYAPKFATALTDLGNAERLAKRHAKTTRFCGGSWYHWDGRRWKRDADGEIVRKAVSTVRSIYNEAAAIKDDDLREATVGFAQKSEAAQRLGAMVSLAEKLEQFVIDPAALDADPMALNCLNGVVDLCTGDISPHDPSRFITKLTPIAFDPAARSELWDRFLRDTFRGDEELIAFVQRAAGYSSTGSNAEEVLFMALGPTRAGKGTFFDAIYGALGDDYSRHTDPTTLLADPKASPGKARPDLHRLIGARFVGTSEIEKGARLDEPRLKSLVGGDPMAVRDLYKGETQARATFKVWFAANLETLPRLSDDDALWRRIVRVPFERSIAVGDVDLSIKEALKTAETHRRAVLAWAVRGAMMWRSEGLRIPDKVATSAKDLRDDLDPLRRFIDDHLTFDSKTWTSNTAIDVAVREWAESEAISHPTKTAIGLALRKRGAKPQKNAGNRGWYGVKLDPPGQVDGSDSSTPKSSYAHTHGETLREEPSNPSTCPDSPPSARAEPTQEELDAIAETADLRCQARETEHEARLARLNEIRQQTKGPLA